MSPGKTMSAIGEALDTITDFEYTTPSMTVKTRERLNANICNHYLEPLSEAISKTEIEEEEEEDEEHEDQEEIIECLDEYLTGEQMNPVFRMRNLKCNGVLPFISAVPVPEWEKRDVAIVISFGFPNKVPGSLRAHKRSNMLLGIIESELDSIFSEKEVTEVDHNKAAKVPYLLCTVDDVTCIIKISIKPFSGPQYLARDIVNIYKKYDDRFIVLANYFHNFLKTKAINKRDQRKAKSVIPKLTSTQMMFIHFFKHYELLPDEIDSLESKFSRISLKRDNDEYSLGTLFYLFLNYYLDVVSLETEYLQISDGEVFMKKDINLTNKNILSISDVFDDHFPGERVNDTLIFKRILKSCYLVIYRYLENRTGDVLNNLRVIPMRPRHVEL